MAKTVADPLVRFRTDVSGLVQDFGKAGNAVKGFRGQAMRAAQTARNMGRAISIVTAGAAALSTGLLAAANRAGSVAQEIQNLANVAGVNAEELQRMAVASETVGIEQEKLADILKDVNDKVGDFLNTGGGPMADFFEVIAPKVGVTADQFRNLNSADALQLYVTSLERANLSQSEMTFYMEALASDATALIPLLAQNGQRLRELGDAAQDAGRILSSDMIDKGAELKVVVDDLTDRIGTGLTAAVLENADELRALADFINDRVLPAIGALVKLAAEASEVVGGMVDAADRAVGFSAAREPFDAANERHDEIFGELDDARDEWEPTPLTEEQLATLVMSDEEREAWRARRNRLRLEVTPEDDGIAPTALPSGLGSSDKPRNYGPDPFADADRMRDLIEARFDIVQRGLLTEEEAIREAFQRKRDMVGEYAALEGADREAASEARVALAMAEADQIEEVTKRAAERQLRAEQTVADFRRGAFVELGNLLGQFAGKSKEAAIAQIAINRALSIAQIIQNTSVAATRTVAELGPIAGPPVAAGIKAWGAAQVALVAATGLAQAANASSSGPSVGAGSSGGGAGTPPIQVRNELSVAPINVSLDGEVIATAVYEPTVRRLQDDARDGALVEARFV